MNRSTNKGQGLGSGLRLLALRQAFEQYLTSAQTRSHFLRHVNGRPQWLQVFVGRSAFLRIDAMIHKRLLSVEVA